MRVSQILVNRLWNNVSLMIVNVVLYQYVSIYLFYNLKQIHGYKIAKHITYYWNDNHTRIDILNEIIRNVNTYSYETDIFIHTNMIRSIHTNTTFSTDILISNTKGSINIIKHHITYEWYRGILEEISNKTMRTMNKHLITKHSGLFLSWKCRELIKEQSDTYDIFMYIEDDIIVPNNAIVNYWMNYKDICLSHGYNLGFIRVEMSDNSNQLLCSDIALPFDIKLSLTLNTIDFVINNRNVYCAFWIYDRQELLRWINSEYFNPLNVQGYDIRERSAIGFIPFYNNTILPYSNNLLLDDCKIFHLKKNSQYVIKSIPFTSLLS